MMGGARFRLDLFPGSNRDEYGETSGSKRNRRSGNPARSGRGAHGVLDASTISAAQAQSLVDQSRAIDQIEIVDLKGRRAGKNRMIVRAEFRPGPNAAVRTIYLQMRTRTVGRLEVRRETGVWKWRTSVLGGF